MQNIKSFLNIFIQPQKSWKKKLLQEWPTIIGPLAANVSLEKIYDELIILGVPDSCWLQELYLLSDTILATVNKSLDQPRIKQVRFKQVLHKKKNQKVEEQKQKNETQSRSLSNEEKKALDKIEDPQLKRSLHTFLSRCQKEK